MRFGCDYVECIVQELKVPGVKFALFLKWDIIERSLILDITTIQMSY